MPSETRHRWLDIVGRMVIVEETEKKMKMMRGAFSEGAAGGVGCVQASGEPTQQPTAIRLARSLPSSFRKTPLRREPYTAKVSTKT